MEKVIGIFSTLIFHVEIHELDEHLGRFKLMLEAELVEGEVVVEN